MFHKVKRKQSFVVAFATVSSLLLLLTAYQNCGGSLTALNSGNSTSSSSCEGGDCSSVDGDGDGDESPQPPEGNEDERNDFAPIGDRDGSSTSGGGDEVSPPDDVIVPLPENPRPGDDGHQTPSENQWIQVAKRTKAQKMAGIAGGEGWQMIFGIAYAPSNSNIAYMVTDTNQVWKTTNANAEPHDIVWQRKTNGFYASGGVSLAFDPTNADIVYVAGGRVGTSAHNDLEVEGIFRTSDGGDHWTLVKTAHFHRSQGFGIHIVFAGSSIYAMPTEGGLLKSTNGGTTWNLVNKSGGGYVLDDSGDITDIQVHPTDSQILFISTSRGLYKVVDSGSSATVTKIGTGLPRPYATVINHNDPNIIFAAAGVKGVYTSTNGGLNFSQIMASPISNGITGAANRIIMSPVNPNKLMVPYTGIWPPNHLYYTSDGGVNWTKTQLMDEQNTHGWVAGSLFTDGGGDGSQLGYNNLRPSITFHPTNEDTALVSGYGSVIKKTIDGGVTWKYANTGYTGSLSPQSSLAPIAWDASNIDRAVFFHLDFGTMLTENNEDTFRSIATIKHNNSRSASVGALNGNIIVKAVGTWEGTFAYSLAISRDSGSSFSLVDNIPDSDWTYKLIGFHPQNNSIVYAGEYKFNNIRTSNVYLTLSKAVTAIFAGDGKIVYSSNAGQVYKSIDGGVTWTQPYPSVRKSIRSIVVDPTNQNRMYLAVRNEGVYIITDTFANGGKLILRNDAHGLAKSRFNSIDINSVAVDPKNPNVVYAGAHAPWRGHSNGVFRSIDYGMTWTNINGNLGADMNVSAIVVNPSNSYVYLSSLAGTWKLSPPASTSTTER